MLDKEIKEIELTLLSDIEHHFTALKRNQLRQIVDALREGQVWYDRFNQMERNINRVIEMRFFKHYTVENIRNLINNIKDQNPLDKKTERPRGLYEDMIDKMALEYIKKLMAGVFGKIERCLEKE